MSEAMLADVWEKSALYYDAGMIRRCQAEWDESFMHLLKSEGGKALDLGTGDGQWAFTMERLGYETISIDQSETRLKKARQMAMLKNSRCRFDRGCADMPNFRSGAFNVVFTRSPFWEWPDATAFLQRVRDLLSDKGTFLSAEELPMEGNLRTDLARSLLEHAGFIKTACREVTRRTRYRFEELAALMEKNQNSMALKYHHYAQKRYRCEEMNDLFRELGLNQWHVFEDNGVRYFEKRTSYMAVAGYKEEEINLRNFENAVDNDSHLQ
jgi:ubiquinone/menaquinone biosynthesis C-methylase UbiE